jgi:tetratricopeptide (TPR) repeat protein
MEGKLIQKICLIFLLLFIVSCIPYTGRDSTSQSLYESALENYRRGDYKASVLGYTEVIGLNPEDAGALYGRGAAYEMLNEYTKAIVDFDKAITLNPKLPLAYMHRAFCKLQLDDCSGAYKDISQASKVASDATTLSWINSIRELITKKCKGIETVQ